MDTEMIRELAVSVNNVAIETAKPYQEQIAKLKAKFEQLERAYKQYTTGEAIYYHDVLCNADRRKPMGCDICSCKAGKELKQLRAKAKQLEAEKAEFSDELGAMIMCKDEWQGKHAEQAEEIERLRSAITGALGISDLWTLKEVETQFEDEAKALEMMKTSFEQALKEK